MVVKYIKEKYSEDLKDYRKRKGLSKYRMAKEIGCTYMTYWRWEKGKEINSFYEQELKHRRILKKHIVE